MDDVGPYDATMDRTNERVCFKCGKKFAGPGAAMNMEEFGPMAWCLECMPPVSVEEALETIERFRNPPKEPGKRAPR